jgi:hypothetical protein
MSPSVKYWTEKKWGETYSVTSLLTDESLMVEEILAAKTRLLAGSTMGSIRVELVRFFQDQADLDKEKTAGECG